MTGHVDWPADQTRRVPTEHLIGNPRNARVHSESQIASIAAAITRWGWTIPVLVDEHNHIIAGHARVAAARTLGIENVPVTTAVGWSDAQKRAYMIADNKLALNSAWDEDLLRAELSDLVAIGEDAAMVGFDVAEMDVLFPQPAAGAGADDVPRPEDDLPDIPPPVTQMGDVWSMGSHRLACGDSTDPLTVAGLMEHDRAALLFTSPPYGQQRNYTTNGIADWDALMMGVFSTLDDVMHADGQVIVNLGLVHRSNEWVEYWHAWTQWMSEHGWRRFGWYVWDQGPGLPGDWNGRLAPSFEFLFHFNRQARRANKVIPSIHAGKISDGGLRSANGAISGRSSGPSAIGALKIPDNVIRLTRHKGPLVTGSHPAVFPIRLPELIMDAYSSAGDVVFEPFSGSGTTLLAGQSTGRSVRAIDLAPEYVDLAIARWMLVHPDIPVLDATTSRTYAEVAAERVRVVRATSRKRRDK